jgi:hypothetical protein
MIKCIKTCHAIGSSSGGSLSFLKGDTSVIYKSKTINVEDHIWYCSGDCCSNVDRDLKVYECYDIGQYYFLKENFINVSEVRNTKIESILT